MNLDFEYTIKALELKDVVNIYEYGSRVYGTDNSSSDKDYIIVVKGNLGIIQNKSIPGIDATIYSEPVFQQAIFDHEVSALECFDLPNNLKHETVNFSRILDLSKLRESFSAKASNSWVKAKKKFEVEKEVKIAKKSLFHALRILRFGIQIANHNHITDYSCANHYWIEIQSEPSEDWQFYKDKYQSEYNRLKSEFKKVAPL